MAWLTNNPGWYKTIHSLCVFQVSGRNISKLGLSKLVGVSVGYRSASEMHQQDTRSGRKIALLSELTKAAEGFAFVYRISQQSFARCKLMDTVHRQRVCLPIWALVSSQNDYVIAADKLFQIDKFKSFVRKLANTNQVFLP